MKPHIVPRKLSEQGYNQKIVLYDMENKDRTTSERNSGEQLSIKRWAEEDRPREKLLAQGAHVLSDAELLAILIGSGTPSESAVELSRRILHAVENNLNELGRLS
ncbi:MAG: hypothetical protein LBC20_16320, partial [Planctomycetaceae bacterium]|nr:hypothetical protein [Planctomycetaceae bacterium]